MASTAGRRSSRVKTERTEVSASDFEKEIISLSQASESINGLIYGDSNAGKTVLSGSLPGRTFWLIGEPGYKAAARQGAKGRGRRISDTATAWAAVDWLEQNYEKQRLDWIVLDGLSTMEKRFRLGYAAEAFDIDPTKRQHRNLPDRPDYFNTQNFLTAWIPRLVDLPVNLLITAHAYRTDKTENGELLVFPGIQGKVSETANSIAGLMDFTGYLEARQVRKRNSDESMEMRRLWFTQPYHAAKAEVRYVVGDKFNCLAPYWNVGANQTVLAGMPELLARINGEEDSA
jgi:hypothetical protein